MYFALLPPKDVKNKKSQKLIITYKGKTQTLANWCRELKLNYSKTRGRLVNGWSIEKALTTPVKYYKKQFTKEEIEQMKKDKENGMSYKELGIKYNTDRCI